MEFNILVTDGADSWATPMLIMPFGKSPNLPEQLRRMHWRELATVTLDDRLVRERRPRIEAEIASRGYSLLACTAFRGLSASIDGLFSLTTDSIRGLEGPLAEKKQCPILSSAPFSQ